MHLTSHPLKWKIQWLLVQTQIYATIITINFRMYSLPPEETPYSLAITSHCPIPLSLLLLVVFSHSSCLTLCNPMDCSPPGSSVQGVSRQEYWSALPFPLPGNLPEVGIELTSPALAGKFFTTEPHGKPTLSPKLPLVSSLSIN